MENQFKLTPAQQAAADGLREGIAVGEVCVLRGSTGSGKTTVLRQMRSALGGAMIGVREFIEHLSARQPMAVEESLFALIESRLAEHDLLIVDDLHLIVEVVESFNYPRNLLDVVLTAIVAEAGARQKTLVFAVGDSSPGPVGRRAYSWQIGEFEAADMKRSAARTCARRPRTG